MELHYPLRNHQLCQVQRSLPKSRRIFLGLQWLRHWPQLKWSKWSPQPSFVALGWLLLARVWLFLPREEQQSKVARNNSQLRHRFFTADGSLSLNGALPFQGESLGQGRNQCAAVPKQRFLRGCIRVQNFQYFSTSIVQHPPADNT